jgi:hypothetical protein
MSLSLLSRRSCSPLWLPIPDQGSHGGLQLQGVQGSHGGLQLRVSWWRSNAVKNPV